jgi:hypothetical protein
MRPFDLPVEDPQDPLAVRAAAVACRHAEVDKVMQQVQRQRQQLAQRIASGQANHQAAALRNAAMPGLLGQRWAEFMGLSDVQKIQELAQLRFNGMAWQSLLQCNPYLV